MGNTYFLSMVYVKKYVVLLLAISFSVVSLAAQTISVKDHDTVKAKISATAPTRLSVKDDHILIARGVQGAYTYTNDTIHGAVFLQPTETYQNKPFYLFLDTEQGHHYLMELTPDAQPAGMLLLVHKETSSEKGEKQISWTDTPSYSDSLTSLMKFMANHAKPDGYEVIAITQNKPVLLGENLKGRLKTVYRGTRFNGEVYEITNISKKPILLTEQTFYRAGDKAIRIQMAKLPANGTTLVYKVVSHG